MSIEVLTARAMRHWTEFLPQKTADLKEAGTFEFRARKAAVEATNEIQLLMRHGMTEKEAEEMVLPEYILLPPER